MSKRKFAFLYSCDESAWVSCKVITPNLRETYERTFSDCTLKDFHFDDHTDGYELYHLVQELIDYNPDTIVILDHKPHPKKFLIEFCRQVKKDKRPEFIFHLFGDFSIYCREWYDIESLLQECRVKFIAASHAQVGFVKQFIKNKSDKLVSYMPFPVDEKQFFFDAKLREEMRKKLGFDKDEKIFLYTGRLSAQKNVIEMVQAFIEVQTLAEFKCKLVIAGEFDNMGYPFFGNNYPDGFNYFNFLNVLEDIPKKFQDKVKFVGNLSAEHLLDYYNASDVFVSLSQHNDEDYGMSPAEALCCGMRMILSGWGGYHSFKTEHSDVLLIDVELKNTFFKVNFKKFVKILMLECAKPIDLEKRELISKEAHKLFSIQGNIERLKSIVTKESVLFSEWGKNFSKFQRCFATNYSMPFAYKGNEIVESERGISNKLMTKKIYQESYNEYIKPSEQ